MDRNYETMVIVRSDISEQEQGEVFAKVTKKIEALGGKIEAARVWAKERTFTYFLKSSAAGKKKFDKGCYWLLNYLIDTDKLGDLKETIRLEERILRYLILRQEEKKAVGEAPEQVAAAKTVPVPGA
ncbi:MAG: 30S ribosomal protein S6 [Candidatus Omnitrophota bacterium]|nr:30S ribosomal protein S6 [Candidatus Omnitrophota bacterium]